MSLINDFEQQKKSFKQDDFITILRIEGNNFRYHTGWDEVSKFYHPTERTDKVTPSVFCSYENYRIKVFPESALAIYDQSVYNLESEFIKKYICVRVLEKVEGEWKIIYSS
ncbi:MAG: hypothetical protein KQI35_18680 [Bacteroidetes bacterium]|nr:hypothetical protein [Bacteroidota bacterium]